MALKRSGAPATLVLSPRPLPGVLLTVLLGVLPTVLLTACASDVRPAEGEDGEVEAAQTSTVSSLPLGRGDSGRAPSGGVGEGGPAGARGDLSTRGERPGGNDELDAGIRGDLEARGEIGGFRTHLYSERDADVHARPTESDGETVTVVALHAELGDRVAAGALLATLDDDGPALAVAEAEPAAREAAAHHERMEELHRREMVSDAEHEAALFARERTEARLQRARLALERTRIRAPFAGVVSRRYVRVGETVDEARPLFRITALAPLRARLLVPEGRAAAFRPGTRVRVEGPDGRQAEARVVLVGPTVDPGSGTREVVVELEDSRAFPPGASVLVHPPETIGNR